jgi:hypothetical protein
MAFTGVLGCGICNVGKEGNALESKEKVYGEIKGAPPVGAHVVVSWAGFQVAAALDRWRVSPITMCFQYGGGWQRGF